MFDITIVQKVYPEQTKVYGPYLRPDGRKHVVLAGNCGYKRTVSYPKFIKELELSISLGDLTVDHQDRDKTNDENSNLIIRPRSEHTSLDARRVKVGTVVCPICGNEFTPTKNQINKRAQKTAGPFCSRSCAGKYSKSVQMGGEVMPRTTIELEYYQIEKD